VSNYYGNTELLYSYAQAATTTTPTAGAVSMIATWPSMEVPPGYFVKQGKQTSAVKLLLRGTITTTATIPSWLFGVAWTQSMPATFSATNAIAATTTRTPGAAQAGAWFELELDISLRTLALAAASTLIGAGSIRSEGLLPAAFSTSQVDEWSLPATGGTGVTGASIDVDQPVFLWPYVTLGAATAGNTVTSQLGKLYGEN
jgi:hypothetical protein